MSDEYKPRFIFEITEAQKERADRLLATYGLRKAVFSHILDDVLDILEEFGGASLGLLITGKCKPRDIIPTMKNASRGGELSNG
jgi:hypothetical protein